MSRLEYPVPKSSIETVNPDSLKAFNNSMLQFQSFFKRGTFGNLKDR